MEVMPDSMTELARGSSTVPLKQTPENPIGFNEVLPQLLKVLASETPLRLVKSGKAEGLVASRSGQNADVIHALTTTTPSLLKLVGVTGKPESKPLFVWLTDAGLAALAAGLPLADLDMALAQAAPAYRSRFRDACVQSMHVRLQAIADRQKALVAESKRLVDVANQMVAAQLAMLTSERLALEQKIKEIADAGTAQRRSVKFEPCHDRDYEFIQRVADLLIMAWQDTSDPEARSVLEGLFSSVGITPVGKIGETVSFDGRYHDTSEDVEVHDDVVVVQPGWQLKTQRGPLFLAKASVDSLRATTGDE